MVTVILSALICLFAGIMSGLLGVGGGLVLVPLFYYLLKMDLHVAIGTSLALIVPTALVGALRYASGNYIDWRIFAFSFLFTVVGGLLGASFSMQLDVDFLRKMFAVFLVLVALKMFLQ